MTHTPTVTSHEIRESATPLFWRTMAEAAQTPELALRYLDELSTDIRAALILDAGGDVAACSAKGEGRVERMRELTLELFAHAGRDEAVPPAQVEVRTAAGGVFAVRQGDWTIAVVTGRFALPSLVFYDLRSVLSDLGAAADERGGGLAA